MATARCEWRAPPASPRAARAGPDPDQRGRGQASGLVEYGDQQQAPRPKGKRSTQATKGWEREVVEYGDQKAPLSGPSPGSGAQPITPRSTRSAAAPRTPPPSAHS